MGSLLPIPVHSRRWWCLPAQKQLLRKYMCLCVINIGNDDDDDGNGGAAGCNVGATEWRSRESWATQEEMRRCMRSVVPWHRDPVCGDGMRAQQTRYTRHFLMCTERRVALLHHIRLLHKVRQRNGKLRNEMCMRHDWNSNFLVPGFLKAKTTNSTSWLYRRHHRTHTHTHALPSAFIRCEEECAPTVKHISHKLDPQQNQISIFYSKCSPERWALSTIQLSSFTIWTKLRELKTNEHTNYNGNKIKWKMGTLCWCGGTCSGCNGNKWMSNAEGWGLSFSHFLSPNKKKKKKNK